MNRRFFIIFLSLLICTFPALSVTRTITLDEAIAVARRQSVDAAVAYNELKTAYWQYRTYRADLLPEIGLAATIPSYRKSYSPYQMEDGAYKFVRNNYLQTSATITAQQNIWFTGGKLSLSTSLDYLRQFGNDAFGRMMSVPIALTLSQPLFATNHLKWQRRIEPSRYEEAKARYLCDSENVAMKAVGYFFNLIMTTENLEIARQNRDNSAKLYEVAKAKRRMGQISENDLLQMELNLLNDRSALTDCESENKASMFALRSFLGMEEDTELLPVIPSRGNIPDVSYSDAIARALHNNPFSLNIRRRQLEADYEVAKAKGAMREISLFAQFGYTGTGDSFQTAYSPLKDNQIAEIGVNIPILDWGKRKGKVKVAESNREVVKSRLRQESADFAQNIFILVERFNNQRVQLDIASRADTIAMRRYDTNVETFMIGKISTLDLNDSQSKKDISRREYINQLYLYWYYYYQLRSLTLWDYSTKSPITE